MSLLPEQPHSLLSSLEYIMCSSPLTILVCFCLTCCTFNAPLTLGSPKLDIATAHIIPKILCKREGSPAFTHCAATPTAQGALGLLYCKVSSLSLVQVAVHQDFYSNTCLQAVGIQLGLLPGNVSLKMVCPHCLEFWASLGCLGLVSQK